MIRSLTLGLVMIALVGCSSGGNDSPDGTTAQSEPDKEAIQSIIRDQISQTTDADGRMTVQGTEVTFDHLHDGLETKDGMYVSCADFKTGSDETYDIDYYVESAADGGFEVAKVTLHGKTGTPVNEVLWTKEGN